MDLGSSSPFGLVENFYRVQSICNLKIISYLSCGQEDVVSKMRARRMNSIVIKVITKAAARRILTFQEIME